MHWLLVLCFPSHRRTSPGLSKTFCQTSLLGMHSPRLPVSFTIAMECAQPSHVSHCQTEYTQRETQTEHGFRDIVRSRDATEDDQALTAPIKEEDPIKKEVEAGQKGLLHGTPRKSNSEQICRWLRHKPFTHLYALPSFRQQNPFRKDKELQAA